MPTQTGRETVVPEPVPGLSPAIPCLQTAIVEHDEAMDRPSARSPSGQAPRWRPEAACRPVLATSWGVTVGSTRGSQQASPARLRSLASRRPDAPRACGDPPQPEALLSLGGLRKRLVGMVLAGEVK
jgi:hypothetical protein